MENADLPECEREAKRSLILLLASVALGPFTLIPAMIYAHRARRHPTLTRRRMTMATLVIGYAVCLYSLVMVGIFLLPARTIAEDQPLLPNDYRKVDARFTSPTSDSN